MACYDISRDNTLRWQQYQVHNDSLQRFPNFMDVGPNLRSYQRPRAGLFRALKNNTHITFVQYIAKYFLCAVTCIQYDLRNCFVCCIL